MMLLCLLTCRNANSWLLYFRPQDCWWSFAWAGHSLWGGASTWWAPPLSFEFISLKTWTNHESKSLGVEKIALCLFCLVAFRAKQLYMVWASGNASEKSYSGNWCLFPTACDSFKRWHFSHICLPSVFKPGCCSCQFSVASPVKQFLL